MQNVREMFSHMENGVFPPEWVGPGNTLVAR